MSDDAPRRFFDQATRDYHHALRRIQRRRTRSIANWLIVPWLIAGNSGRPFGPPFFFDTQRQLGICRSALCTSRDA